VALLGVSGTGNLCPRDSVSYSLKRGMQQC
jgi:hypothetical protein